MGDISSTCRAREDDLSEELRGELDALVRQNSELLAQRDSLLGEIEEETSTRASTHQCMSPLSLPPPGTPPPAWVAEGGLSMPQALHSLETLVVRERQLRRAAERTASETAADLAALREETAVLRRRLATPTGYDKGVGTNTQTAEVACSTVDLKLGVTSKDIQVEGAGQSRVTLERRALARLNALRGGGGGGGGDMLTLGVNDGAGIRGACVDVRGGGGGGSGSPPTGLQRSFSAGPPVAYEESVRYQNVGGGGGGGGATFAPRCAVGMVV